MKKIIIFGTGKMGEMVHFYFKNDSSFEIAAFTSDKDYIKGDKFMDLPVVPFEEVEKKYPPTRYDMFVAVGYDKLNSIRLEKYNEAK